MLNYYQNRLISLKKDKNERTIKDIIQKGKFVIYDNKTLLNLSSNDYLGLSTDSSVKDNFLSSYKGKIQNPSSRLLSGSNRAYIELEHLICDILKVESALLFNSGYHANVGIYSALLNKGDIVFIDKLNHASIIDGIKLSGAKIIPFSHLDYEDLENKLITYRKKGINSIISSESLFSMDGDFADINKLIELKEKYNSILVIDEAHSFGVYGKGLGYVSQTSNTSSVDLIMGTFGKAIASYGAFVAGKKVLIDNLINFARPFIFSTSLPEISVAFSTYIIKNYILKNELQPKLFSITKYLHNLFYDLNTLGNSYIVPIIKGENKNAILASDYLINEGFYVLPVRYPTVKKNQARIRLSINPSITTDEIDKLYKSIKKTI